MTKRRMMLVFLLCVLIGGLGRMTHFQACILASDSKRSAEMSEAQSKREAEGRLRQRQLERHKERAERKRQYAQKMRELKEQGRGPLASRKQDREARKKYQKEIDKAGGIACYVAKSMLGESEERWTLLQPKLKKVQDLRNQATSTIGAGVSQGSSDSRTGPSGPRLQWERPWKYTPIFEMTEAQRLARDLRTLLERKDTPSQAFSRKMAALRKARSEQAEIGKQLTEARLELRQILTTREEAILVLLGWF